MSDIGREDERDLVAAEYVLGLLEGDALVDARRLATSDEAFARAVAAWEERLAPLAGEAPPVEPDEAIWPRIQRAIAAVPAAGANVIDLRRRLKIWRGIAAGAGAMAASLALVVAWQASRPEEPQVVQPGRAPVMVATLASPEETTSLAVAYDAGERSLMVTPGRMEGAPGHEHELWIVPAEGTPVSLGIVRAGAPQRLTVPAEVAPHFTTRSAVALSVEPTGGSPTGQPTGPVVASGALVTI
jgi:anti-sigma-K factor RskA